MSSTTTRLSLYLAEHLDNQITSLQESMEKESFFPHVSRSQFVSMLIETGLERMTELAWELKTKSDLAT